MYVVHVSALVLLACHPEGALPGCMPGPLNGDPCDDRRDRLAWASTAHGRASMRRRQHRRAATPLPALRHALPPGASADPPALGCLA